MNAVVMVFFQLLWCFKLSLTSVQTSHLICFANQVIGFFIQCNTGLKWVKHVYESRVFMVAFEYEIPDFHKIL